MSKNSFTSPFQKHRGSLHRKGSRGFAWATTRSATPFVADWESEVTPAELADALGGRKPEKLARVIARERLDPRTGNGRRRGYPRATVERLQDIFCRGISISTSNGYLTAIKGFSRWLVEKERNDRDRLASLSRLNEKTDRRHVERVGG